MLGTNSRQGTTFVCVRVLSKIAQCILKKSFMWVEPDQMKELVKFCERSESYSRYRENP